MNERHGCISIDCDTISDYLVAYQIHPFSQKGDQTLDPVYAKGIPRFLDLFAELNIKATFFVVGRDLTNKSHLKIIRRIVEEGHEIANHTLNHRPDFLELSSAQKEKEIMCTDRMARELLGVKMVGFRGPGYEVDAETLRILRENGYLYDCSVFPSFLFPLIKMAVWLKSREKGKAKRFLSLLKRFGPWAMAPRLPYRPALDKVWQRADHNGHHRNEDNANKEILEIPITVLPILNLPFYGTFLLVAGKGYSWFSLSLVKKMTRILCFEYHAVDLVHLQENEVDPRLTVHPGLTIPLENKRSFIRDCLSQMQGRFQLLTGENLAKRYLHNTDLSHRSLL